MQPQGSLSSGPDSRDESDDGEAGEIPANGSSSETGNEGEELDGAPLVPVPAEGDEDPSAPAVTLEGGCGRAAALASGAQTLSVEGVERSYVLDLPEGYDPSTAYPLVFGFHGATTSGQFFRSPFYGDLLSTMAEEAIVVHPDALGTPTAWNTQADLPFFDALLAELKSSLCVDSERVFATGHSSGGFFTNTLGCQRGDVLAGIAPVSGGGPFVFGGATCTGEVAVWLAHGENDMTVLFENGEQSRDRWLDFNGCDASAEPEPASPEPCVEYSGCEEGLPVRWCVYQDGHNWPDFAPEGIWEFFRAL